MLVQVAESLGSQARFVRVNVAVEDELAGAYAIRVTPTLLMFLDGREVGRVEGPRPNRSSLRTLVTAPFTGHVVSA